MPHTVPYPVHVPKPYPVHVQKLVKVHEPVHVHVPKPVPYPVHVYHDAPQAGADVASGQQQHQFGISGTGNQYGGYQQHGDSGNLYQQENTGYQGGHEGYSDFPAVSENHYESSEQQYSAAPIQSYGATSEFRPSPPEHSSYQHIHFGNEGADHAGSAQYYNAPNNAYHDIDVGNHNNNDYSGANYNQQHYGGENQSYQNADSYNNHQSYDSSADGGASLNGGEHHHSSY